MTPEAYTVVGVIITAVGSAWAAWRTATRGEKADAGAIAVDLVKELRAEVEALRQDVDELRAELDKARRDGTNYQTQLSLYVSWCTGGHVGRSPLDPAYIRPETYFAITPKETK